MNVQNKPEFNDSPEKLAADLVWSTKSYTLTELCKRFGLPQVIKYDDTISLGNFTNFDLSQPLLAYSARAVRKVCASPVDDKDGIEPIIIPQDYTGWFSVLSPECVTPHYSVISSIAVSNVTSFLVTTRLPGFQVIRETGKYIPRFILPGEILVVLKTYVGTKKVKDKSIFKRKKSVEVKYLLCLDANEQEVLFSMDQKGSFYAVTVSNKVQTACCILRMTDILQKVHFPVVVRLVYGRKPMSSTALPNEICLKTSFMDDSVVALTMLKQQIFLELPKSSSQLQFKLAVKSPRLIKSSAFTRALCICKDGVETYMKDIKVSLSSAMNENKDRYSLDTTNSPIKSSCPEISKHSVTPGIPLSVRKNNSLNDIRYDTAPMTTRVKTPIANGNKRHASMDTAHCQNINNKPQEQTDKSNSDALYSYAQKHKTSKRSKIPLPQLPKRNNSNFTQSTSLNCIPNQSYRLSFEGTYIVISDNYKIDPKTQEPYKERLRPRNSFDNSIGNTGENIARKYINTAELTRSSSEGTLVAQLGKPNRNTDAPKMRYIALNTNPRYVNAQTNNSEFLSALKKVRPVEQAMRMSVYGDIEGWDVVDRTISTDTHYSGDSGYLSMNDIERTSKEREKIAGNNAGVGDARCSSVDQMEDTLTPQADIAYVKMNDLKDEYNSISSAKCQVSERCSATDNTSERLGSTPSLNSECSISPLRIWDVQAQSVSDIAEHLRRCGIRECVVQQFINEKIDGSLLACLDLDTIRETFSGLRSIEAKKIWMMVTSGWLPNDNT